MLKKAIIILGLVLIVTGCAYYEPAPRVAVYSDIEWITWEYYDWDYNTVVYLRSLNYSSDDVCLVLFLAWHGNTTPSAIVRWRKSGISWMNITTVHLKLNPTVFYVNIPRNTKLGPPYGKAYGYYWNKPKHFVLTHTEMVSLVYLKTTSLSFGIKPLEVIKMHHAGHGFNYIVNHHVKAGKHITSH